MLMLGNSANRYGAVAQLFHWLIAALILVQFILVMIFEDMPLGLEKISVIVRHKAFGMTLLMLAILRLCWKLGSLQPQWPVQIPSYERWLGKLTHWGLYIIILALPLSGWLMSSAAKIPVSYFGLFYFPDLIAPDKNLVKLAKQVHEILSWLLLLLLSLHVLAVIRHHFLRKDDTLYRMLPEFLRCKRRDA